MWKLEIGALKYLQPIESQTPEAIIIASGLVNCLQFQHLASTYSSMITPFSV